MQFLSQVSPTLQSFVVMPVLLNLPYYIWLRHTWWHNSRSSIYIITSVNGTSWSCTVHSFYGHRWQPCIPLKIFFWILNNLFNILHIPELNDILNIIGSCQVQCIEATRYIRTRAVAYIGRGDVEGGEW